jgi:hypothetical protein
VTAYNVLFFLRIEKAKENLRSALAKSNPEINKQDIERFLNFPTTDEELNLLSEGLKIFSSKQNKFNTRLSVSLMQLFYLKDKTDKALELFMDKVQFLIPNF